jgi:hypothetical protein
VQERVDRVGDRGWRGSRAGSARSVGIGQWLGSPPRGILGNTDFDAQISYVIRKGPDDGGARGSTLRDATTAAKGSPRQHV